MFKTKNKSEPKFHFQNQNRNASTANDVTKQVYVTVHYTLEGESERFHVATVFTALERRDK